MDSTKRNRKYNVYYESKVSTSLRTQSTAEKIQDVRQQLEEVLASAYDKRTIKKTPRSTKLSPLNNHFGSPSLRITESRDQLTKNNLFHNDSSVPVDAKLLAYKKFIRSLTRIIRDTSQHTPDSFSLSTCLNTRNVSLGTQKRSVDERRTFLIEKEVLGAAKFCTCMNQNIAETKRVEKSTYCRPVACSQEWHTKTIQKNIKLQLLIKKLVKAREKEKQNEAWNNYINELKNKHRYCDFRNNSETTLFKTEDEKTLNIMNDNSDVRPAWKQSNLCLLNNLCRAADNVRELSDITRSTWCAPSTCKTYKYANNSFCCPVSSQRLMMMRKERRGPGYTLRPPGRFFRGSSIIVEKQSPTRRKTSIAKSRSRIRSFKRAEIFECRAIQTADSFVTYYDKENEISDVKTKYERVSNLAEKLKDKIKEDNKKTSLVKIDKKLDKLISSFNAFLEELRLKKITPNVKSEAVSCSSICSRNNTIKAKSNTCSVLTKQIICDVAQHKPYNNISFSPRPISQHTIHDILSEEKVKSEKVRKDIDDILKQNTQCAVQITIDIPTRDHYTEVTNSFYERQKEDPIVEEIECEESEDLEKIERSRPIARSLTIAVNTDPMGILALIRVSMETVKQILSYVPNLDYVTYLARRQLGTSTTVARYVCNICNATFARPSALSDHIQDHNVANFKDCCVCRHVLDRLSRRSGLFACTHCGQMFTRAYCRELHEQNCNKKSSKHSARPSFIMLS